MAQESYNELIFLLGDLAREHLAEAKHPPKAMEAVFAAEDVVLEIRGDIEKLEEEMNEEDGLWQDFLAAQDAERIELKGITTKWRTAVVGVEGRSRELKKKLSSMKAAHRYQKTSVRRAEHVHKEMELREGHDVRKIAFSKENLKKLRLMLMREQRHLDELEFEFNQVLTPRPGQQGAQGILAHKRLLEMEDEHDDKKAEHEERMKELDEKISALEAEQKDAETELDNCLFDLGEEAYADRIPHPKLNPLYARLDKAK